MCFKELSALLAEIDYGRGRVYAGGRVYTCIRVHASAWCVGGLNVGVSVGMYVFFCPSVILIVIGMCMVCVCKGRARQRRL